MTEITQPSFQNTIITNSAIVANYVKNKCDWAKISRCRPGEEQLDSVLIYLFTSQQRVINTAKAYQLGQVSNFNQRIVDYVDPSKNPGLEGIIVGKYGSGIFDYEMVLDELYNISHRINPKYVKGPNSVRFANRNYFVDVTERRTFDDFELEF